MIGLHVAGHDLTWLWIYINWKKKKKKEKRKKKKDSVQLCVQCEGRVTPFDWVDENFVILCLIIITKTKQYIFGSYVTLWDMVKLKCYISWTIIYVLQMLYCVKLWPPNNSSIIMTLSWLEPIPLTLLLFVGPWVVPFYLKTNWWWRRYTQIFYGIGCHVTRTYF